jgi:hypothetical protein
MARTKLDRLAWDNRQGWLGTEPATTTYKYTLVGDRVEQTKTVVVHSFSMGDVEDPDLYAAEPLIKWERSEEGQWVMANAVETPSWHRMADPYNYGYRYEIRAKLQGPVLTEWLLRYSDAKR